MRDKSNLEFVGVMKTQSLTTPEEDSRNELAQIQADPARFAGYGANSEKKVALLEGSKIEEEMRERFPGES